MDRLEGWEQEKAANMRQLVQQVLQEHARVKPAYGEIEMYTLFDEAHDRYPVVRAGWLTERRMYGALIHVDLKGGKCWIQYDGTEVGWQMSW